MRTFLLAALAATALVPSAAMARSEPTPRPAAHVTVVDRHPAPAPATWRTESEHRREHRAESRITVGARLTPAMLNASQRIAHPARYRLAHANARQHWVRVQRDAVLVHTHSGRVVAVVPHLFR